MNNLQIIAMIAMFLAGIWVSWVIGMILTKRHRKAYRHKLLKELQQNLPIQESAINDSSAEALSALQIDVEQKETLIASLREQLTDLSENPLTLIRSNNGAGQDDELARLQTDLTTSQTKYEDLSTQNAQLSAQVEQLSLHQTAAADIQQDNANLTKELRAKKKEIHQLQVELKSLQETQPHDLDQQLTGSLAEINQLKMANNKLQEQLIEKDIEHELLHAKLATTESNPQTDLLEEQLIELRTEKEHLRTDFLQLQSRVDANEELKQINQQWGARLAQLEADLREEAELRIAAEEQTRLYADRLVSERTYQENLPLVIMEEPLDEEEIIYPKKEKRERKDNLKRINGIGKVYEQRLNAEGIKTFLQLEESPIERLKEIIQPQHWQDIDFNDWIMQANNLRRS